MRLHYIKPNHLSRLHDELVVAGMAPDRCEGLGDDVWLTYPDGIDRAPIDAVVDAHSKTAIDAETAAAEKARQRAESNAIDVRLRFAASALKDKTPAQIYQLMQGRIDGWDNLAQAKADLREWLPLVIAGLAWMVMERE